jgi:predicted PurR-regulated permease PerM
MQKPERTPDLPRIVLGILMIGALLAGSFWVLRPFLPALVWAAMIVVATWPLLLQVQRVLGGHRSLAVAVMIVALLAIIFIPLAYGVAAAVEQAGRLADLKITDLRIPPPPAWVGELPMIGARVAAEWQALSANPADTLVARLGPYARDIASWIASHASGFGGFVVHLGLTVVLCGVLYGTGEHAAHGVRRLFRRLHGEHGDQAVVLAGASIRAVAMGIVVTALVQTLLGALGLYVAGVPHVALLATLMFVFCIVQIGPMIVLLSAVGWLYYTDATTAATALLVWTAIVGSLDNILRPMLIKRGADLPFLLILSGVIGGLLGFGLVGLFVGPVILAVTWRSLEAWVAEQDGATPPQPREP